MIPPPPDMPGAAWLVEAMEVLRAQHLEVYAEQQRTAAAAAERTRKTKERRARHAR